MEWSCVSAAGAEILKSPDLFSGRSCPVPQGPWVGVYVIDGEVRAFEGDGAFPPSLLHRASMPTNWFGKVRSFWLSFDRCNRCLKFGVGHYREETTLLAVALSCTGEIFSFSLPILHLLGLSDYYVRCSAPRSPPLFFSPRAPFFVSFSIFVAPERQGGASGGAGR